jgi:hypothetical protein
MSKRSGLFLATLMGMLAAGGCTPKSGTEAGGTEAGGTEVTEAGGTEAGDPDGGTPPAGPQFSLINGAVTRFEGAGAPAYAIAALDEQTASQTHRIWKLAGPAGTPNDHLTRWHVPTIVQTPAKCLEDGPGGEFT